MRTSATFAAVLIALLAATAARAAEKYPSGIRSITATTATSSCIGNPKTPVCAVETFRACSARLNNDLCLRVGIDLEHESLMPKIQQDLRYRILSARILRPGDIPSHLSDTHWMKPGHAEITLLELPDPMNTCPEGCKYSYYLHPENGAWQIVRWSAWDFDD